MANRKQIIIAGGGHAGLEAAFAISRMGGRCTIVTMDTSAIGRLSCNPAMGGLGKSHLVKEVDALGGIMGYCSDIAGIQFKTLNKTKGRAVWSLRAQVDKKKYPKSIGFLLSKNPSIKIMQGEVVSFTTKGTHITKAILKDKTSLGCDALIITCGTFLNGLIHIGNKAFPAGRMGEGPAQGLTETLKECGFKIGRLKTGTPPRLERQSINWALCKKAGGDSFPSPFSLFTPRPFSVEQEPCYLINTNKGVHTVINNNINKSAMFSGKIQGVGPRYCPSIEDKIFRFSAAPSHHLFLEPEWSGSNQIYLNGFSTSLPEKTQKEALRQIPALAEVEFIRPGYAIEYDYAPPYQLTSALMSKEVSGLFFAGQINGTSGYEEAAAQGLVAGANAQLFVSNKKPLSFNRQNSYIGVMVDDLITSHLDEPYRMFTSRAEHRLFLRSDNCYSRLYQIAQRYSLLTTKQLAFYSAYFTSHKKAMSWISKKTILIKGARVSATKFLRRPESSIVSLVNSSISDLPFSEDVLFKIETDIKYEGYIKNELKRIKAIRGLESLCIPRSFNYGELQGLSNESCFRLNKIKPETLGQASRISGIRPTDITLIGVSLQKRVSRET